MKVLVTGGSSGIGAEIVRQLRAEGHDTFVFYNRSEAEAHGVAEEAAPGGCTLIRCDLADLDAVRTATEGLLAETGGVDALVHVAGASYDRLAATIVVAEAERLFRVNFFCFVELVRALVPGMINQRRGRILAISSVGADLGRRGNSIYCASKGALESYLRCLVDEVRDRGVGVNWIRPGFIETRLIADTPNLDGLVRGRVPMKRCGEAAEVARVARFLLSDEAPYLHGAGITVDGGLSAIMGAA